ncbi:MAG: hypothetical protein NTW59_03010 [Candidatus Diapherotrites archaeon]|nr:hypothetical protein [Candidatus Diapherotrites archaeon]
MPKQKQLFLPKVRVPKRVREPPKPPPKGKRIIASAVKAAFGAFELDKQFPEVGAANKALLQKCDCFMRKPAEERSVREALEILGGITRFRRAIKERGQGNLELK